MNSNTLGNATVQHSRWEDEGKGINPIDWTAINNNQYVIDKVEPTDDLISKTKAQAAEV